MESLYLLVPVSVLLILGAIGVFAWAVHGGQFEDLALEGERVLFDEQSPATKACVLDVDQTAEGKRRQE